MTAADELRAAAARLKATNDVCQHPGCGCPEELHQHDADGLTWCKDCFDQHPYQAPPAADVPERLRGPLAGWLETTGIRLHHSTDPGWQECVEPHAVALARLINPKEQ